MTVGQVLTTEQIKTFPMPLHAFQIEQDLQLAPIDLNDLTGIFTTNHSCAPNCGLRNAASLVAIRNIPADEEICFDYAMCDKSPDDHATVSMDCKCGKPNCRGRITDLDWQLPLVRWTYCGFFSTYIEEAVANLKPVNDFAMLLRTIRG